MAKSTKEHFWPQWLINKTGTHRTGVRFTSGKRINPRSMTIPLCSSCNNRFGNELEAPVSKSFEDLEAGKGISDVEAERLVRWLWKFEGLSWRLNNPEGTYAQRYTLRDRVLMPIDDIRSQLTLAISLADQVEPEFGDAPMGLDSWSETSAIHVAGVFSRIALMVLLQQFESMVPPAYSLYRLAEQSAPDREAKLFFPKTGFRNCVAAVETTRMTALILSHAHELEMRNMENELIPSKR